MSAQRVRPNYPVATIDPLSTNVLNRTFCGTARDAHAIRSQGNRTHNYGWNQNMRCIGFGNLSMTELAGISRSSATSLSGLVTTGCGLPQPLMTNIVPINQRSC